MLEGLKPEKQSAKCKIGRFYDELEPADQKLLDGYLADADFSAEQLSAALKQRNIAEIGPTVIRHHRAKSCPCNKLK
jgi:hypothetical protein